MNILKQLQDMADASYATFQSRLIPEIDKNSIIGVRVPQLRQLAKQLISTQQSTAFIQNLPHVYYEENMLHAILISQMDDTQACLKAIDSFLPFVNNWVVCDSLTPRIFKSHKKQSIKPIYQWCAKTKETYPCRFGIKMLMSHYLDSAFKPKYLEIPANIQTDEYYLKMMIAWYFATALAKQWECALPYIQNYRLSPWIHQKTLQKARESFRIPDDHKRVLEKFKKIQKNIG